MGMDWDPEGDAERRRESWKRWMLVLAICGGIGLFIFNLVSKHMEEKARERQMQQLIERQYQQRQANPYRL